MKVKLSPSAGALVSVKLKNGKTLGNDEVESIDFDPFFSMPSGPGSLIVGVSSLDDGTILDRFDMQVSGASGKVTRRDRVEKSVIPMVERKKKATTSAAAASAVAKGATSNG